MTSVVQSLIRVILGLKGFFAARPGMPAGILAAVARLSNFAEAMRALGETQATGEARSMKAVSRAEEVRRYIWFFIIQPLGLIAVDAFSDDPSRKVEFRMTRALHSSKESFLARARAILAAIRAAEAILLEYGMDPGLPALLEAKLHEYAALPEEVTDGRRTRSGATDSLDTVTKQALNTLRRLDGLVRHHFRDDPATLAEWASVRNIPWPSGGTRTKAAKAQAPAADGTTPATDSST